MSLTRKQLAVIHVARSQLGLTDTDYRAILRQEAGVDSSRDLTGNGLDAVMTRFQRLGFTSTTTNAPRGSFGDRPGMASPAQIALIRKLWRDYTDGQGTEATLGKWLDNKFEVSSLRFLPAGTAQKVVGALKVMVNRRDTAAKAG